MVYDLLYDSDTVVIGIFLAGLLLIPFFMSIKLIVESRQRARAAGYRRVIDHLRAIPQTDQEKKEAVAMMLRGIVLCMLGIVLQQLAHGELDRPAPAVSPLEGLIRDERARALWLQVCDLPAGERAAVVLYYRQELPIRQVAVILGVTPGTVKTFLFRARRRLLQRLTTQGLLAANAGSRP